LRRRNIALDLYPSLAASGDPLLMELCDTLLGRLKVSNRTNKRTHYGRFGELDQILLDLLVEHVPPDAPITVLDVGVSDGRTAAELFAALSHSVGDRLSYVASDKYQHFVKVDFEGESFAVVLDADDEPCQIIRPPFVLNVYRPENPVVYPVNKILGLIWLAKARRLLRDLSSGAIRAELKDVRILHPSCESLVREDVRFSFESIDILGEIPIAVSLARAMNVLNRTYFSDAQALAALRNLSGSVEEGGFLVIASNDGPGSELHGGIYRKTGSGIALFRQLGNGWEFDELVGQLGSDE
jgi:hypothetical protein